MEGERCEWTEETAAGEISSGHARGVGNSSLLRAATVVRGMFEGTQMRARLKLLTAPRGAPHCLLQAADCGSV